MAPASAAAKSTAAAAAKISTPTKITAAPETSAAIKIAPAFESTAPTITGTGRGSIAAETFALELLGRRRYGGRRCEFTPHAGPIKIVPARRSAQHAASARIRVQPFDPAVRPHPFQMIMLRTTRTLRRPFGVVKLTGIGAAHFWQDTIQRLHAGRAGSLGQSRSGETDGQSRYQKKKAQAHGRFLAFFK
jgi:hypothetical protein